MTISKPRIWTATLALLGIASVAIVAGFLLSTPPYSARSMLLVAAPPPQTLFDTADQATGAGPIPEFSMFQKTQVELLKSRLVLSKALSHPDVAKLPSVVQRPDPVQWLADELTPTFVGELLYIGLEGDDPQDVVKLVNAVTDAYLEEVVNAENNRRKLRLHQLKGILSGLTEKMSSHKRDLEALAARAGSSDRQTVEYKKQLARERAGHAEQDLRALRNQLRDARIDLAILRAPQRAQSQPKAETTDDATGKIKLGVEAQEKRIALLEQEEANLVNEVKRLEAGLQSLNRTALSPESPRDGIQFTEKNAEVIGQEIANLEVELDAPPRIMLYERAQVPTRR